MDYSTLLLEFMDGTLDSADELALFNALSSNEELRGELKHLLAISSSVHGDVAAFIPQTASTQRIFAELGFASPLPIPAASTPAVATAVPTVSAFRRFFPAVGSAVAASLATVGIMLGLLRTPAPHHSTSVPTTAQQSALPTRTATLERIIAHPYYGSGSSAISDRATETQGNAVREVVRYVYLPREAELATAAHEQSSIPLAIEANETVPPIGFSQPLALHSPNPSAYGIGKNTSTAQMLGTHNPLATSWHSPESSVLLVEMSNTVSESFPNATVDPASNSWLNNKSVSVLYPLAENQYIGITFGQEPFFQRFEARNNAGRRYQYEQNPILPWVGVSYRYSLSNLGVFNPFGQFMLGGTQVGALGRTLVGFTYSPNPSIQLMAGINGSLLYYPIQSTWYSSSKLGLTYGIGISF